VNLPSMVCEQHIASKASVFPSVPDITAACSIIAPFVGRLPTSGSVLVCYLYLEPSVMDSNERHTSTPCLSSSSMTILFFGKLSGESSRAVFLHRWYRKRLPERKPSVSYGKN